MPKKGHHHKTKAHKSAYEFLQQMDLYSPWGNETNPLGHGNSGGLNHRSHRKTGSGHNIISNSGRLTENSSRSETGLTGRFLSTASKFIMGRSSQNIRSSQRNNIMGGDGNGFDNFDDGREPEVVFTFFEETRLAALNLVSNAWFSNFLLLIIIVNSVILAFDFQNTSLEVPMQYLELVFTSIYTTEFLIKFYADPYYYIMNNYNRFDFITLTLGYVQIALGSQGGTSIDALRVFRALRAFRTFRMISFFRSLQVIVNALIKTLASNVIDFLLFLSLVLFLFSVLAVNFFSEMDPTNWGTLGTSLTTLCTYVTADNWTSFDILLITAGSNGGSQWFSVLFLFFGHFMFTNLFIAVITQNVHDAQAADLKFQERIREENVLMKKAIFMERQPLGSNSSSRDFSNEKLEALLAKLQETVRHDDIFPTKALCCDLTWLETFVITLNHQENTVYRTQQTHFEIANILTERLERMIQMKRGF